MTTETQAPDPAQVAPVSLLEAIDYALNQAPCECPHSMRFERGEHMSGCYLFDLNVEYAKTAPAIPAPEGADLTDEQINELIGKHAGYGGDDILSVVRAAIAADRAQRAAPAPQAAPDTVPWPVVDRYSGGASTDGVSGRVWVRFGDGPEVVEFVRATPAPAEAHGQMLIDNFKAAHLEWLSVDGDAEDGVPYARASEALAAAEAKLLAALEPRVQPKHTQKPCLVTGDCKHGSWCSDVYCQEHCQFVKGTDALDALADLCGLATGGWDLPPSAVVRIGELARKASAALRAPAPGADRPLPAELGEWLTAIGELYIAMGRPPFEATEPTMGVVETLREAAKRVATIEGLQQAVAAGFPVVARWTKNAKDGAPRARVWVQFEDGGPEVEFASGTQAPAVVDGVAWELPTPAVGDYVLATKWSDGDPGDNWALGFYNHSDTLNGGQTRHYVADSAGKNIRGNGFRKVHGPIRGDVGRWLLEVASKTMEASPPGVVNLWTMLTPFAFDLERDREPVSHPPVQGSGQ